MAGNPIWQNVSRSMYMMYMMLETEYKKKKLSGVIQPKENIKEVCNRN